MDLFHWRLPNALMYTHYSSINNYDISFDNVYFHLTPRSWFRRKCLMHFRANLTMHFRTSVDQSGIVLHYNRLWIMLSYVSLWWLWGLLFPVFLLNVNWAKGYDESFCLDIILHFFEWCVKGKQGIYKEMSSWRDEKLTPLIHSWFKLSLNHKLSTLHQCQYCQLWFSCTTRNKLEQ